MSARVHRPEEDVGHRRTALGAGQVGHQDRARSVDDRVGPETERPAGDDHDDHRLARGLERSDQALLVGREHRVGPIAEALGVGPFSDRDNRRVGRLSRRDRRLDLRVADRLVGRDGSDVRVGGLHAVEHRRRRRDLVGRPHAADVVAGVVDALPAHAPAAELVVHPVHARACDDEVSAR